MTRGLIPAVAILMLTWQVSSSDISSIVCPEHDNNPFLLDQKSREFPTERINKEGDFTANKSMLDMGFKLMPEDTVSCWETRLRPRDQVARLNITFNSRTGTVGVSEECRNYVKTWLAKVTDTVLHNYLILMKARSIDFFGQYFDLKSIVFGPGKLVSDLDEELVGMLEKFGQDLKDTKFPSEVKIPSYRSYELSVGNMVTTYRDAQKYYRREKDIVLPVYPPNEVDKRFLARLVMGTATSGYKPVKGYKMTHYKLHNLIDSIRRTFDKFTDSLSPLMPTVPPCFSIE